MVGLFGAGVFIVITQDLQIFPKVVESIFIESGILRSSADLPKGVESFFAKTSDDELIEIWRYPAKNSNKIKPLIFAHGNAKNLEDTHQYAAILNEFFRYTVYSFDYRGFGRSSGWPSEEGIYRDIETVYKFAKEKDQFDDKDLVLLGWSLGSAPVSYLASKIDFNLLILLAPFTSLPDAVADRFFYRLFKSFLWSNFPNLELLSKPLKGSKVILVHGDRDKVIPISHSYRLHEELKKFNDVILIEKQGAAHNDIFGLSLSDWGKFLEETASQ